ncbi:MAG: biotin/lipoyl-binding protein, partial [Nodosilinea sp.]
MGVGRYYGHPRPATDEIRLSGQIEGYETDLAAKVGGRVVQMSVAEGDRVKVGEAVAQLEDAQIQAQLAQAQVGALVVVALTTSVTGCKSLGTKSKASWSVRCTRLLDWCIHKVG